MKTKWFSGCSETGYVDAFVGDGVKIYPNPVRDGTGGTVQSQSIPTLNTHYGCGGGDCYARSAHSLIDPQGMP